MKRTWLVLIVSVITITMLSTANVFATGKTASKPAVKSKAKYKTASGKIAEATNNERRGVVGGRKGDQTRKEVRISDYKTKIKWKVVIRATNPAVANKASTFVIKVCQNNNIGYNNYMNNQKGINWRDTLILGSKKS